MRVRLLRNTGLGGHRVGYAGQVVRVEATQAALLVQLGAAHMVGWGRCRAWLVQRIRRWFPRRTRSNPARAFIRTYQRDRRQAALRDREPRARPWRHQQTIARPVAHILLVPPQVHQDDEGDGTP